MVSPWKVYKMATFHVEEHPKLTILADDFGILHIFEKNLCVMFGFQPRTVHISKDDAYDDNNNVTIIVYQVPSIITQGLEWTFNAWRFKIVGENLPKNSQNIVIFIVNVVTHDF